MSNDNELTDVLRFDTIIAKGGRNMNKRAIDYALNAPTGGVSLTGGRFLRAFENNIAFLKGFDVNRMLYWFRVHAGKPAPGAPYAAGDGNFENNLHGQTAG